MNWELAEVEHYPAFPPPGGLAWAVLFLCVAVVVARRRPAALPAVWIVSSLLLIAATFLWNLGRGALKYMNGFDVAGVVVLALVPSGLATLALLALRNRPRRARLPVQILCASLALVAGFVLGALALIGTYHLSSPGQAG